MGQVSVTWVEGKQFIGTDSTHHSIVISSPDEGIGMKPSELLLLAVGSCTGYDVVNILSKKRLNLTSMNIKVTGDQEQDPPWRFTQIHIHYHLTGVNLNRAEVEKAIHLSKEKYCSVSNTLESSVKVTYDFEITETVCSQIVA